MLDAERRKRIKDRVDDGLRRSDAPGLTCALDAEWIHRGRQLGEGDVEWWQIVGARQWHGNTVVVALASKLVRIAWALRNETAFVAGGLAAAMFGTVQISVAIKAKSYVFVNALCARSAFNTIRPR